MLFSGIPFLYYFLPSVLTLYALTPRKWKNATLCLASLVFYGWGEPKFLILMVASILIGYGSGLLLGATQTGTAKKWILSLTVGIHLALLGLFKYADFFAENINAVTGLSLPLLHLALPIGISFYTFQILSYTVDVYRGEVAVQKNLITLASYVAMFPQLIAGPIVRYADVEIQLKSRSHTVEKLAEGARRFTVGLGKKVLLANVLGEACTSFRTLPNPSVLTYWLYGVAFCLHVYFDFSGYSDMAIGLGKIFGFDFIENFNYPFISKSATEFWRRWHISLGSWFRDYVYIPMGGNRVRPARHLLNILTVWLLTGLWHGAAWTFVVWGLYFAAFLVLEKYVLAKHLARHPILSHLYLLPVVIASFVIFNGTDLSQAVSDLGAMFGLKGLPLVGDSFFYLIRSFGVVLILGIIGATPLPKKAWERLSKTRLGRPILTFAEPVGVAALLLLTTAYLVDGSFNPFLYFRF